MSWDSAYKTKYLKNNIYKKNTGITPTEYKNRGHLQE